MLFQKYLSFLGISLAALIAETKTQTYPKDYFRNPLDIPITLAGNFGECRPNHFHSGIDIKTQQKENLKVYAAADGYISRIKMEPGGFGHALYIAHPNGYTTVYAHLNDFIPAVQKFVRQEQYKKENWEVDLQLPPTQFPVKKGQPIAWSGNTGGSTAPHLHFEIRDTKTEHPLNPQLFGFDIQDSIAPRPMELAVYNLSQSIYEQKPRLIPVKKRGTAYNVDTLYLPHSETGLGVHVNDFMNGSTNTLNFYTATLYADGEELLNIRLDDIGYDVTRYLHAYVDYKTRKLSNKWIQLMFQLPGNNLNNIYEYGAQRANKGQLIFEENKAKNFRIELTDAAGNTANITGVIVYQPADTAYEEDCTNFFRPKVANSYSNDYISFTLPEKALYDGVCFTYSKKPHAGGYSDKHTIHNIYTPVHTWFDLHIKPDNSIPADKRNKVALVYNDGKEETGKAATYDNGGYKAAVRNFGEYYLAVDNDPPVLTALQKEGADLSKASRISFRAKDEITSVKKFRAELDGKWLLFEKRGDTWFYEFDEHCPRGKYTLVVTAADENNNVKTLRYNFTR